MQTAKARPRAGGSGLPCGRQVAAPSRIGIWSGRCALAERFLTFSLGKVVGTKVSVDAEARKSYLPLSAGATDPDALRALLMCRRRRDVALSPIRSCVPRAFFPFPCFIYHPGRSNKDACEGCRLTHLLEG